MCHAFVLFASFVVLVIFCLFQKKPVRCGAPVGAEFGNLGAPSGVASVPVDTNGSNVEEKPRHGCLRHAAGAEQFGSTCR